MTAAEAHTAVARGRFSAGAALLATLLVMPAAACGVRPTGVIGAGDPAVAQEAVPQTTVYLVRGDKLVPVRRTTFPGAPQTALYTLWESGATQQEAAQGLSNPAGSLRDFHVVFRPDDRGMMQVSYLHSAAVTDLVRAQIVCSAGAQPGVRSVVLEEEGARTLGPPMTCGRFSRFMSG